MSGAGSLLRPLARGVVRAPAAVLIACVRTYQLLLSPLIGPVCRYAPSCSTYAVQALRGHGALRGSWLTARRLLRCQPWAAGGWDPVPPRAGSPSPLEHSCRGHSHRDRPEHSHPEPARTL